MAETKRSAMLDSKTKRAKIPCGAEPQFRVAPNQYLIYSKPKDGSPGRWEARWYDPQTGKKPKHTLGTADDGPLVADGNRVLSHQQAMAAAIKWCQLQEKQAQAREDGEETVDAASFTVEHAMRDYFQNKERTGKGAKGLMIYKQCAEAWIIPELGSIPLVKLKKKRIEAWMTFISESPRRGYGIVAQPPQTDDKKRARKETANRNFTILCAALNYAIRNDVSLAKECVPYQWTLVERFSGTKKARVGRLQKDKRKSLIEACRPDFRQLVIGALMTGCRYGELMRLKCKDYKRGEHGSGSIYIAISKSGKPRTVQLTEAGTEFFDGLVSQKNPDDLVFTRSDGSPWVDGAQKRLIRKACFDAGIDPPIVFHELRHERMSKLTNNGLKPEINAQQAGHSDTKMGEQYYIHREDERIAKRIEETGGADDWEILGKPDAPKKSKN